MNTIVSNEESDLLQKFFNEKQRVQELEEELERVHKTSKNALEIGSDQTLKFKQLVSILRKKYEESQHRNQEIREKFDKLLLEHDKLKKAYELSILEQKQKETLLQTTTLELKTLQTQLQEFGTENKDNEEELHSLKEQLIKLKEMIEAKDTCDKESKEELEGYKQKQKQFERVVHYLRKRLEEAHLENKELFDSFHNTQQTNKQLEADLQENIAKANTLQNDLQKMKVSLIELEDQDSHEKAAKKEFFDQQLNILQTAKDELNEIKCAVVQNLQEFKDEKIKTEELNLKKIEQLENSLAAFKENKQQLSLSLSEWQQKAEQNQSELSITQEQIAHHASQLLDLKEKLHLLEASKEEAETSLRMAQQHLAKKVRETSVVTEENDELKQQIRELQNELGVHKLKILDNQNALELEFQKQKRLQEQYQEGLKSFETHTLKWEEKYFAMHGQWQEAETKLREYKNFEEKYQKMHNILNHLSNLLGKPIVLPTGELSHSFDTFAIGNEKNLQIDQLSLFDHPLFAKEL